MSYDDWKADIANRDGSAPNDEPEAEGPDEPTGEPDCADECGGCGEVTLCTLFVDPPLEVMLCADCMNADERGELWHERMTKNTGRRSP